MPKKDNNKQGSFEIFLKKYRQRIQAASPINKILNF